MAMKDNFISKLWDATFKLLLSCFWHRNTTSGRKEDLAMTFQSSDSLNTVTHDLSKCAMVDGHPKAERHVEAESPQSIAVDNRLQIADKETSGNEENLHKVKSQDNATDGVHNRVDPVVIELKNSDHNCLPIEATNPEMESAKQSESSSLEIPSFILTSKIIFQSAEEHQEPKVAQQLISPDDQKQANEEDHNSNSGHHMEMDVQNQRNETESTKVGELTNENDVFPMEAKHDEVVQEAEADVTDGRNLNDQENGDFECLKDVAYPSSKFPNDRSCYTGSKLLSNTTKPIVLIGTTVNDISPIRALLQERWHQKYHESRQVGKVILYFWCKHPDLDRFYEEELLKFHEEHLVTHMHADFIREADHMVYVDHFLSKHGYDAWDLIDRQQASVIVCGDATAGLKVEKAFIKIAAEIGGKGTDNAQLYLKELMLEGRFITEFSP